MKTINNQQTISSNAQQLMRYCSINTNHFHQILLDVFLMRPQIMLQVKCPWHSASKVIPIEPPWTFLESCTDLYREQTNNQKYIHFHKYTHILNLHLSSMQDSSSFNFTPYSRLISRNAVSFSFFASQVSYTAHHLTAVGHCLIRRDASTLLVGYSRRK